MTLGVDIVAKSFWSVPAVARNAAVRSFVDFARNPGVSNDGASETPPDRLIRPHVVFKPSTPQKAAGMRIDPPVSLPTAS